MIKQQLEHYHNLTKNDFKESTLEGHGYYIKNILKACISLNINDLESIDLENGYRIRTWILSNTRNKNNSTNRHINYILSVQKFYEIFTSLQKIKNLKNDTEPFQRFYQNELKEIINYVKKMNYSNNSICYKTFVMLALDSGVRRSEALAIEIKNIDFENYRIYLKKTKTGKVRYAPFSDFSKNIIEELINVDPKRKFLFYNFLKDRPLSKNDIALFFRRLKTKLDIDRIHTHRFRKTFGSMLAENGMAIEHLQKIYDHTRITTTIKYVQYRENKSLEEYSKFVDWKI